MAFKATPGEKNFLDKLKLPSTTASQALAYYSGDTWPRISQLITTYLSDKGIICTVTPMIEADDWKVYKPWIVVRILPILKNGSSTSENEILNLLFKKGYIDPQYRVHIESGKGTVRASNMKTSGRDKKNKDQKNGLGEQTGSSPAGSSSHNARSVKHLTCWYWFNSHGGCSKSDEDCLYSHSDTGRYADQPRPLYPGGRAVAGRNAERIEATIRGEVLPEDAGLSVAIDHQEQQPTGLFAINTNTNLNTGVYGTTYGGNNFTTNTAGLSPFSSDLAYSPSSEAEVIRNTGIVSGLMIPSSVERLGATPSKMSYRNAALLSGADYKEPEDSSQVGLGMTAYNQVYTPAYKDVGLFALPKHQQQQKLVLSAKTPMNTPVAGTPLSTPKSAGNITVAKASNSPGNKASRIGLSFPAEADRMTLFYSNMHSIMAARELCVGLDQNVSRMEGLVDKISSLSANVAEAQDHQKGYSGAGGIDTMNLASIKYELSNVASQVKDVLEQAKGRRKRAESIMRTEENAKHVFGYKQDGNIGRGASGRGVIGAHIAASRGLGGRGESDEETEIDEGGGVELVL